MQLINNLLAPASDASYLHGVGDKSSVAGGYLFMPKRTKYYRGQEVGGCIFLMDLPSSTNHSKPKRIALFRCRCGKEFPGVIHHVSRSPQSSCGCNCKNAHGSHKITHGLTGSKEYMAWDSMKRRCTNSNSNNYKWYGAKGVKVCKRWDKFENFIEDMGTAPSKEHSLDRYPNGEGDYEPNNCRWATEIQQQRNRSTNKIITIKGVSKCVAQWCEDLGLDYRLVIDRLYWGWAPERAFYNIRVDCNKAVNKLSIDGVVLDTYKSMSEAAKVNGLFISNISSVINGRAKTAGGFKWKIAPTK